MAAKKSAVTQAVRKIQDEAQELDLRRQAQITNQIEIIDRLMDGASYDQVMQGLVEKVARLEAEISLLRAEGKGD